MQNNYDDWNDENTASSASQRVGTGGWHWLLSLVAVLIVSLFSFAMAYLTRWVEERPVWMMGLIFMVPTAALMLAAMMVEGATSAMTPGTSRKPQIIVAIAATIATFLVGCICDLIYLTGFRKPPVPAQSVYTTVSVSDRLILVKDRTLSMNENEAGVQSTKAISSILDHADEGWEIGFTDDVQTIAPQTATAENKRQLLAAASASPDRGRLYYQNVLKTALNMAVGGEKKTRIILFTDGSHPWSENGDGDLTDEMISSNASVYCVIPENGLPDPVLEKLVVRTGGKVLQPSEVLAAVEQVNHSAYEETVSPAEQQEELNLQLDLVRNRDQAAMIITFIMLLLEGLSLGICLSLMLSSAGQFRAQYIISPLMGVLAFIFLKLVWGTESLTTWWVKEGICFSLLGIVFMKKNLFTNKKKAVSITNDYFDSEWG